MPSCAPRDPAPYDLVVVGAGVVGLAHALAARRRGWRVALLERDHRAVGASVRNFGHVATTVQAGRARRLALLARERWCEAQDRYGVHVRRCGTTVVARSAAELGVLEELAAERGPEEVRLLTPEEVRDLTGPLDPALVGGAHLPRDLVLDPRQALPALLEGARSAGVDIRLATPVLDAVDGVVRTPGGDLVASATLVCTGHDVDRLLPDVATTVGVRRCALTMLEATVEGPAPSTAVLTGTSMLRYDALSAQPSAAAVRAEVAAGDPGLVAEQVNLMLTTRPDGTLVVGDTHRYDVTTDPFVDEAQAQLLLRETTRLLGGRALTVRRRWQGVYASSASTEYLVATGRPGVHAVAVTSGIGMTTALGLADEVLDALDASPDHLTLQP